MHVDANELLLASDAVPGNHYVVAKSAGKLQAGDEVVMAKLPDYSSREHPSVFLVRVKDFTLHSVIAEKGPLLLVPARCVPKEATKEEPPALIYRYLVYDIDKHQDDPRVTLRPTEADYGNADDHLSVIVDLLERKRYCGGSWREMRADQPEVTT